MVWQSGTAGHSSPSPCYSGVYEPPCSPSLRRKTERLHLCSFDAESGAATKSGKGPAGGSSRLALACDKAVQEPADRNTEKATRSVLISARQRASPVGSGDTGRAYRQVRREAGGRYGMPLRTTTASRERNRGRGANPTHAALQARQRHWREVAQLQIPTLWSSGSGLNRRRGGPRITWAGVLRSGRIVSHSPVRGLCGSALCRLNHTHKVPLNSEYAGIICCSHHACWSAGTPSCLICRHGHVSFVRYPIQDPCWQTDRGQTSRRLGAQVA